MTDISVSIVAYRNDEDIKAAVESIEKYTNKEITKKIYIVDNSAQPENEARAEFLAFLSQWEDVHYVDAKENLGFGKGHNYVLSDLDSKYHAIVNPDILLVEDSFQTILSYMEQEEVGMVVPKLIYED
ncbi:MAG: glycosyltransferase, partial [Agathobacter sp.]|nr:glycosyltransferase [Agathobacter sp.]